MSAPSSSARAKDNALHPPQKFNPKKRLASIIGQYPFQQAAQREEATPDAGPSTHKRKRAASDAEDEEEVNDTGYEGDADSPSTGNKKSKSDKKVAAEKKPVQPLLMKGKVC